MVSVGILMMTDMPVQHPEAQERHLDHGCTFRSCYYKWHLKPKSGWGHHEGKFSPRTEGALGHHMIRNEKLKVPEKDTNSVQWCRKINKE